MHGITAGLIYPPRPSHPSVIPSGGGGHIEATNQQFEKRLADIQQQIDDLTARINSMAAECQP
jgi:hypothetical protein